MERFSCDCDGPVRAKSESLVSHACRHKYAAATSYYDGKDRFVEYKRTQVNPRLTNGLTKYRWYVNWQ